MYVPATLALAAPPTAPAAIATGAAPTPASPGATVTDLEAPAGILAGQTAAAAAPDALAPTAIRIRRAEVNVLDGHAAIVAGVLLADPSAGEARPTGVPGRIVTLQARRRRGWRTLARARTGARGHYLLRYRTARSGSERLRVSFAGGGGDRGADRAVGRLNVYRLAEASWYGGGGSLACGGWLTSATLGVANKTLPCGTPVTLRYGGHTVRVRVIDRGPYVAGREFDLTEATKRALGFEGVGVVWAMS
jgi:rare lipoprotein A